MGVGWGSRGLNRWKWERTHCNIMLGNTLGTKEKWKETHPPPPPPWPLLPKFKRNKCKAPWVHPWAFHWLHEISIPKRVHHCLEPEWEMRKTRWGGLMGCIMHRIHISYNVCIIILGPKVSQGGQCSAFFTLVMWKVTTWSWECCNIKLMSWHEDCF